MPHSPFSGLSRREFLASSGVAVGMAAPGLFQQIASAAPKSDQPGAGETVLVVVQLSGGNDGLNTVIPYRDPIYRKARPSLAQSANRVLKLEDNLGLHPSMEGFAELFENENLAIVQGIGYPNPNRSHFASMDIWHRASRDKQQAYGWLGRTMPLLGTQDSRAGVYIGGGETPLAMFGRTGAAPTFESLDDYVMKVSDGGDDPGRRRVITGFANRTESSNDPLLTLLRDSANETYKSSEHMRKLVADYKPEAEYPANGLGERLKLVAQLIDAGTPERIYYTQQGGYDTHAVQAASHGNLLGELSGAVTAFTKDMEAHGHGDRVVVMVFSEFGRRIQENGSNGTDHGAASQLFLAGKPVSGGVLGDHPDLDDPERGDLKFHTDFRSVYSTLLNRWLGVNPAEILEEKYSELPVLTKMS